MHSIDKVSIEPKYVCQCDYAGFIPYFFLLFKVLNKEFTKCLMPGLHSWWVGVTCTCTFFGATIVCKLLWSSCYNSYVMVNAWACMHYGKYHEEIIIAPFGQSPEGAIIIPEGYFF